MPGRWVDSCDLEVGDVLLLRLIAGWRIESLVSRQINERVYNFQVQGLHNYAVGDGVLVHNNSPCFYTAPNGVTIKAPNGYAAVTGENGKGLVLLPKGQSITNRANIVRYGEATARAPQGYFRYYNSLGQPINPLTGNPGSNALTHILPSFVGRLLGYPQ